MPATIPTVLGEITGDELGFTLTHERLASDLFPPTDDERAWAVAGLTRPTAATASQFAEDAVRIDMLGPLTVGAVNRDNLRLDDEQTAVREVREYLGLGGRTIVDAASTGSGRDPAALRRIARASGAQVVMGSGWFHPAWTSGLADRGVDDLAAEIERDLRIGVDGVRAGIIGELAALDPTAPDERRLLTASARAAQRTGAPLVLSRSRTAAAQTAVLALLADEGVRPHQIAIAHCDALAPHPDDLLPILEAGAFAQFDHLGRIITAHSEADDQEVATAIVDLAKRGHGERMLISSGVRAKVDLGAFGGTGYAAVPRLFLWLLDWAGGADLVDTLTIDNPRRWLTGAAPEGTA